ncbi:hypothetical protein [Herbidospora daliensis]|uniref:hypothetical protein n=1 Tax=Herbidospora daliensis TaxID=295585 RepID=UPI0007856BC8|nr:hypothetical protein [Herbidospora daliensis]
MTERDLRPVRDPEQAPPLPVPAQGGELDRVVYAAEVVDDEVEVEATDEKGRRLPARIVGKAAATRGPEDGPTVGRRVLSVGVTIAMGWFSWLFRAGDAATYGVYRRQIKAAEAVGDREALTHWLTLKDTAANSRHARVMDLPAKAFGVARVLVGGCLGLVVLMVLTATLVWAVGAGEFTAVFSWVATALRWFFWTVAFLSTPALIAFPFAVLFAAYREGSRRGATPTWLATSADLDIDIEIDETTIARALGALRIPQITAYLKEGLPLQFIVTARRDGRGTYAEVRLPAGVTADSVARRRAQLATGLYRLAKEVWPGTGSEAGILKLWIADKGALAEGAGPYPLLTEGTVDVFEGVPLGKTLRGDPVTAPLMERNTIAGGQPGQGKSSLARCICAGWILDPTAELWIGVPDTNYDFELFKRRCARYVMGNELHHFKQIRDDLLDLEAEVQKRGQLLIDHEEPQVTRKLADAGIGLHPLLYLLEEAHLAIQHKKYGKEISQLLIDIVRLGRKRGIHVIVSTQAPTKDSMPRDVTRNCSNGCAFYVGDHVANDALLGQGAYAAGHRATELIPGVDRGTAVCKGITGERSEIVQIYFISITKGRDELTPIVERSLALLEARGSGVPGTDRPQPEPEAPRDLLEDLAAVLGDEPTTAADLPALLAAHAPGWALYKSMTGVGLRALLSESYGVRVPSTGNKWPVSKALILDALAARLDLDEDEEDGS